jgi:hypothetical protein
MVGAHARILVVVAAVAGCSNDLGPMNPTNSDAAATDGVTGDGSVDPPATAGSDARGIKKIYPDADSRPEQQYLDEGDIMAGRIDNRPDRYRTTDEVIDGGRHAVEVGGTSRLALYSTNGNPFGSVEHTVYFKFLSGPNENGSHNDASRLFQPYIGGGSHHTDGSRCCEGNAMKVCLFGGGDLAFRKELCHPAYAGDRGDYNDWGGKSHGTAVWNGPIRNMKDGMLRRWYGFKQIEIHLPDRNRQEVWIDEGADDGNGALVVAGNEDRWRLLAVYEDVVTGERDGVPVGDWTSGRFSECTGCVPASRNGTDVANGMVRLGPYAVSHPGAHDVSIENANAVVLRLDGPNMRIAHWSLRKIAPPTR